MVHQHRSHGGQGRRKQNNQFHPRLGSECSKTKSLPNRPQSHSTGTIALVGLGRVCPPCLVVSCAVEGGGSYQRRSGNRLGIGQDSSPKVPSWGVCLSGCPSSVPPLSLLRTRRRAQVPRPTTFRNARPPKTPPTIATTFDDFWAPDCPSLLGTPVEVEPGDLPGTGKLVEGTPVGLCETRTVNGADVSIEFDGTKFVELSDSETMEGCDLPLSGVSPADFAATASNIPPA